MEYSNLESLTVLIMYFKTILTFGVFIYYLVIQMIAMKTIGWSLWHPTAVVMAGIISISVTTCEYSKLQSEIKLSQVNFQCRW